jgi:hypothetical protein
MPPEYVIDHLVTFACGTTFGLLLGLCILFFIDIVLHRRNIK